MTYELTSQDKKEINLETIKYLFKLFLKLGIPFLLMSMSNGFEIESMFRIINPYVGVNNSIGIFVLILSSIAVSRFFSDDWWKTFSDTFEVTNIFLMSAFILFLGMLLFHKNIFLNKILNLPETTLTLIMLTTLLCIFSYLKSLSEFRLKQIGEKYISFPNLIFYKPTKVHYK